MHNVGLNCPPLPFVAIVDPTSRNSLPYTFAYENTAFLTVPYALLLRIVSVDPDFFLLLSGSATVPLPFLGVHLYIRFRWPT